MSPQPGPTDDERWAAAAAWSRRGHLTPMETVMWRSERHPVQSSTSCVVIVLDRAPDWDRFLAAHDWGTRLVARLRQRVVEPALPTTEPAWVDDQHFRLDYHVRRAQVSGDLDTALEMASQVAIRPFDRTRPLWEGVLIEGLADGRAVYVLKIHHALADPLGTVQLLSLLQSSRRRHIADKPTAPVVADRAPVDPVDLARRGFNHELVELPSRAVAAARLGVLAARNPGAVVGSTLKYAASVRRLVMRQPAPPSPLFRRRDARSWQFVALSADLADLRAAGTAAGASLSDVAVAAVLGGLRRYHARHDEPVSEIPVAVRVSLDRADDTGNRYAGAMISAPVGIEDPVDRIAAVRGEVLSLHTERALEAFAAFAPVANRLPSGVGAAVLQAGAAADAFVLTLPGPSRPAYMAGAKVEEMYSFGPLPGVALTATLLTVGDRACLGVNVDGAAVPDLDVLRECLAAGLAEVASS